MPIANKRAGKQADDGDQPPRRAFAARGVNAPRAERAGADQREADDGADDHDPRAADAAILECRVAPDLMGEEDSRRCRARGRPRA